MSIAPRQETTPKSNTPESNVLLAYASTHGHTAKIASRIADAVGADAGTTIDVRRLGKAEAPDPGSYHGVIVGASIHAGRFQREIVDWARRHHTTLTTRPSAFFSVCLTVADDTEESRRATREYIDKFVEQTGWTPGTTTTFAGAVQYLEYDLATRLLVRLLMHRHDRPTDVTQDFDCTDWDAVERFGREWAARLPVPAGRP